MKVVADASLLIALSSLNRLSLLKDRFPEGIMIPAWPTCRRRGATTGKRALRWAYAAASSDRPVLRTA